MKSAEQKKNFDKEDDDAHSTTDSGASIELMIDDLDDNERDDNDDDAPWLDDPLEVKLTGNVHINIDDDIDIENTFKSCWWTVVPLLTAKGKAKIWIWKIEILDWSSLMIILMPVRATGHLTGIFALKLGVSICYVHGITKSHKNTI